MAEQGEHGISWCDRTWNPIRGCSMVSKGCENCYAMHVAARFSGRGLPYEGLARKRSSGKAQWTGVVRVVYEHTMDPIRWRKPQRIFVNSMSDLFHEKIAPEEIARIFAVMGLSMALGRSHTFQVLTKRAERMHRLLTSPSFRRMIENEADTLVEDGAAHLGNSMNGVLGSGRNVGWPFVHVHLGVSCEDQPAADERIPFLIETPAAVKWISAEPLLGPIDFRQVPGFNRIGLDLSNWWVVVGGESGVAARWMLPAWPRSIRDQCAAAGVRFHFKQWGEWAPNPETGLVSRVGKRKAGRELDGRTWDEFPRVVTLARI